MISIKMTLRILLLVISLIVGSSRADDCNGAVGGNWVYSENIGRCFRYIPTPMSFKAAQRYCSRLGFAGSLAFLNNNEVSQFARTAVTNAASTIPEWLWIGLTDEGHEGVWKSVDGESPEVTRFRVNQPDNYNKVEHFAHINGNSWDWNDVPESSLYPFICQVEPADFDTIQCPDHWVQHGDLCYKYIDSKLNWYQAQERCDLLGNEGALAFVGSEQDNDNVFAASGTDGDFWIGLTDLCHEKEWSGPYGKRTGFRKWRPDEPNDLHGEDCVHITKDNKKWNDLDCGKHTRPFVCQKSARFSRNRCPPGSEWVQRGENCYRYYKSHGTWEDASAKCRDLGPGGTLPFIASESENQEVYQAAARSAGGECVDNFKSFWIGITDKVVAGAWTNPDGAGILSYAAWAPGEPNDGGIFGDEGYVEMYKGTAKWNDENGSEDAYVCRLPAEPKCNPICPEMWTAYNGACYLYNGRKVNQNAAKMACQAVDASLISHVMPDSDEHRFLGDYIDMSGGAEEGEKKSAWIDLNDVENEGVFVWGDNSAFDGVVQEPAGRDSETTDCVVIKTGLFLHTSCDKNRAFVCKKHGM